MDAFCQQQQVKSGMPIMIEHNNSCTLPVQEVVTSEGDPQTEDPEKYFLAHLAPSSFHGTAKMKQ